MGLYIIIALAFAVTPPEDFENVKVPTAIICAGKGFCSYYSMPQTYCPPENDPLFPAEVHEAGEKHLKDKNIPHEFKTYSGVPHGKA